MILTSSLTSDDYSQHVHQVSNRKEKKRLSLGFQVLENERFSFPNIRTEHGEPMEKTQKKTDPICQILRACRNFEMWFIFRVKYILFYN